MHVSLLDGYIDEPSSLGVPPFISPIVRYMAGAILDSGHDIQYHTIDAYRASAEVRRQLSEGDLLVMISGVSVPGKYARGAPMSTKEVIRLSKSFPGPVALAGFMAW